MGGMGIDFSHAEKRERNGKCHTANEVNAAQYQKGCRDHVKDGLRGGS
jgi:hypothetical protein